MSSTPFEFVVAGQSVANRASGYDMPGVTVDGQSVLDMYEVSREAVRRARSGDGPTLIEAQTYRYQGHFGADNTLSYRTEEEEAYYHERDCIRRMSKYLLESDYVTEDELREIDSGIASTGDWESYSQDEQDTIAATFEGIEGPGFTLGTRPVTPEGRDVPARDLERGGLPITASNPIYEPSSANTSGNSKRHSNALW